MPNIHKVTDAELLRELAQRLGVTVTHTPRRVIPCLTPTAAVDIVAAAQIFGDPKKWLEVYDIPAADATSGAAVIRNAAGMPAAIVKPGELHL